MQYNRNLKLVVYQKPRLMFDGKIYLISGQNHLKKISILCCFNIRESLF